MSFFIGVLTVFMVLDCLVLILLVLMQLPKKEAGAGLAFGGAATDALFGAGSGNFLTKATKYAAIIFFGFAVVLSLMQTQYSNRHGSRFRRELQAQQGQPMGVPGPGTPPAEPIAGGSTNVGVPVASGGTNFPLIALPPGTAPTPTPPPAEAIPTNPAPTPQK